MGSVISFLHRLWNIAHPVEATKVDGAIRLGVLGASFIAPEAVIAPAKSHAEVIIAAVAARDKQRATAYAKKHGIPIVHDSYDTLLADPSIDAIYIPLPNSHHYDWALRSLKAGKHVLLEKPSVSNASEATSLFANSPSDSTRPILLEAFHYRFHPAWNTFLSHLNQAEISTATANMSVFKYFFSPTDIRFQYPLAGGALMDMGTYPISALRDIFGGEPSECLSATPRICSFDSTKKCDEAFQASWRWPNGGVGSIDVDLRKTVWGGWVPWLNRPNAVVTHRPIQTQKKDGTVEEFVKTVTLKTFAVPHLTHSIETRCEYTLRSAGDNHSSSYSFSSSAPAAPAGKILKTWKTSTSTTAYTWPDGSKRSELPQGEYWTTYRYMLEEFVNRIKGRPGSGLWVDGEDSIKQMQMIDQAYIKAGLGVRGW